MADEMTEACELRSPRLHRVPDPYELNYQIGLRKVENGWVLLTVNPDHMGHKVAVFKDCAELAQYLYDNYEKEEDE